MAPISIMTAQELELSLKRIASEMMEACAADKNIALIGVLTRGEPLARRLAGHIEELEGISPPWARSLSVSTATTRGTPPRGAVSSPRSSIST